MTTTMGASLAVRLWLLGGLVVTGMATSLWRVQAGHEFRPGLFSVIFLPLSVGLFVLLDIRARFEAAEWVAAMSVVAAHLVLSVPGSGGPLYYRGTHLVRPDHFMHVIAGGLVAWLSIDVLSRGFPRRTFSRRQLYLAAFVMALAFGAMKETTDLLSVRAAGLRHDQFDSVADGCANAIGAVAALWWCYRGSRDRPATSVDEAPL